MSSVADVRNKRAAARADGTPEEGAREFLGAYRVPQILARSHAAGPRYSTGISKLDEVLRKELDGNNPARLGTPLGRILSFIAPPHVGKSVAVDQCAFSFAKQGLRVVILVQDEPREDAAERIGQQAGFRHAELNADYPDTLARVAAAVELLDISILPDDDEEENGRVTIEDASRFLLSVPNPKGYVLVVDSLHRAVSEKEKDDDPPRVQVRQRMEACRSLRKRGVLVLLTVEANRSFYVSKDPAARTSAMGAGAESRDIEYASDVQLVLTREDSTGIVTVEHPKNRIGRKTVGSFSLRLNQGPAQFTPVSDEAAKAEVDGRRAEALFAVGDLILDWLQEEAPENGASMDRIQRQSGVRPRADLRAALKMAVQDARIEKFPAPGSKGGGGSWYRPARPK